MKEYMEILLRRYPWLKERKLWRSFLGIICVLGGVFYLLSLDFVTIVSPKKTFIRQFIYASGHVEPLKTIKISARTSGRLKRIEVEAGDFVKPDQVLAYIENYLTQQDYKQIEAKRAYLAKKVESQKKLRAKAVVSELDYLHNYYDLENANADLERHKANLNEQIVRIKSKGIILEKYKEPGESILCDEPIFLFGPDGRQRIVAHVDSEDILYVQEGQLALVISEAADSKIIETRVQKILPLGDKKTRTFKIYLGMPENVILPYGLPVKINILVRETREALIIPSQAVFNSKIQIYDTRGSVYERHVRTGTKNFAFVEIQEGVNELDRVVTPFDPKLDYQRSYWHKKVEIP